LSTTSHEILCLIDGTWHEDSYSCKHWSAYAYHLSNQQRGQLAIARKNEEDAERRHRETLEYLVRRDPPLNITLTQTQHQTQSQNQTQIQQQSTPPLPEQSPTPFKRFKWFRKLILGVVIVVAGAWATYFYGPPANKDTVGVSNIQQVRGAEVVNIADLEAGRDNITNVTNIFQSEPRTVESSPFQIAPVIRVTPTRFRIYKPSQPQAPGQEKAWIQVKVSNDSSLHSAHQVHVRFLTSDGLAPEHRADSDKWNAQQGTASLYTFDLPPGGFQEVIWRPDIPRDSQALYGTGKAWFTLAIHVSWEDLEHKKYESFDEFELAYNRELKDFVLEKKVGYNSFFDGDKIRGVLSEWSQLTE